MVNILRIVPFFLVVMFSLSIISCSSTSTPSPQVLTGTAATGKSVSGFVFVIDAAGTEVNKAIGGDGRFTVTVTGMSGPFMIKVVPDDGSANLFSYAATVGQIVNVTPMTNLAMFLAAGNSDLNAIFNSWNGVGISAASITDAKKKINANLEAQFAAEGLDATSYDFFSTAFSADSTGLDALLDKVSLVMDTAAGTFTLSINGVPLTFNEAIDISGINFTSSGSGSTGAVSGTLTFSGTGASTIQSGVTFSPGVGEILEGSTRTGTYYALSWLLTGSVDTDYTRVSYGEVVTGGVTSYQFRVYSTASSGASLVDYDISSVGIPFSDIKVDKSAGTITIKNFSIDAVNTDANTTQDGLTLVVNGGLSAVSSTTDTGGSTSNTLPDVLSGKAFTLTFDFGATDAPYNDGDTAEFTFNSNGALLIDNVEVASSFTEVGGEFVWEDKANNVKYTASLFNGTLNEVNVSTSTGKFLGQFTP